MRMTTLLFHPKSPVLRKSRSGECAFMAEGDVTLIVTANVIGKYIPPMHSNHMSGAPTPVGGANQQVGQIIISVLAA
jgi:hypothetical protein